MTDALERRRTTKPPPRRRPANMITAEDRKRGEKYRPELQRLMQKAKREAGLKP